MQYADPPLFLPQNEKLWPFIMQEQFLKISLSIKNKQKKKKKTITVGTAQNGIVK